MWVCTGMRMVVNAMAERACICASERVGIHVVFSKSVRIRMCDFMLAETSITHTQSRRLGLLVYTQVLEIYGFEPLEVTDALVGLLADALNTHAPPPETDLCAYTALTSFFQANLREVRAAWICSTNNRWCKNH